MQVMVGFISPTSTAPGGKDLSGSFQPSSEDGHGMCTLRLETLTRLSRLEASCLQALVLAMALDWQASAYHGV